MMRGGREGGKRALSAAYMQATLDPSHMNLGIVTGVTNPYGSRVGLSRVGVRVVNLNPTQTHTPSTGPWVGRRVGAPEDVQVNASGVPLSQEPTTTSFLHISPCPRCSFLSSRTTISGHTACLPPFCNVEKPESDINTTRFTLHSICSSYPAHKVTLDRLALNPQHSAVH